MMNSLKIRRHLAVLAAASGLALAWADAASAAAFDPAALPGHGPSTAGVVSDIECDPAPGTSGRPSTYRHTKKVKAFKENLNSPARSAIGPIPKASPSAAAKPKPKSTKPVAHRAPRRKPSVMERVRQNCHQIVPPAALEFAGIVPDTGDDLEDVADDTRRPYLVEADGAAQAAHVKRRLAHIDEQVLAEDAVVGVQRADLRLDLAQAVLDRLVHELDALRWLLVHPYLPGRRLMLLLAAARIHRADEYGLLSVYLLHRRFVYRRKHVCVLARNYKCGTTFGCGCQR